MTTERERFEAWVGSHAKDARHHNWGWWAREAWQAARSNLLTQLDTQEMVEVVARAICGPKKHLDLQENRCWLNFEIEAKAALTAIKEKLNDK